jgi:thioredoxin 1
MTIIHINNETFDNDVLNSDIPVLLDFWAEWCGPCKMIGPILEELSEELEGKIKIAKIDVDQNNQIAVNYSIRSIPTLIIISGGEVKGQHIGAVSKAELSKFISENI